MALRISLCLTADDGRVVLIRARAVGRSRRRGNLGRSGRFGEWIGRGIVDRRWRRRGCVRGRLGEGIRRFAVGARDKCRLECMGRHPRDDAGAERHVERIVVVARLEGGRLMCRKLG